MERLEWERMNKESTFWRPESDKQYVVELSDWSIEERQFPDGKNVILTFKVLSVTKDGDEKIVYFHPPKTFSTGSSSFVEGIKSIIDNACDTNKNSVLVFLRKSGEGKKTTYSVNDASMLMKFRSMVKL